MSQYPATHISLEWISLSVQFSFLHLKLQITSTLLPCFLSFRQPSIYIDHNTVKTVIWAIKLTLSTLQTKCFTCAKTYQLYLLQALHQIYCNTFLG